MEFFTETLKKSTGVYPSSESMKNFKIRIKIGEMQKAGDQNYYEKEFSWQEKVLSKDQKEFYKDERNCFTELEKEFNRLIISEKDDDDDDDDDVNDDNNDFLFTYCNEENFVPSRELLMSYGSQTSYLEKAINNMKISISSKKMHHQDYDFNLSLKNAIENPFFKNEYEFMYIMVDFGDYFEDTWIKNEKVLCTLKYNLNSGVLQVFPDFTNTHPYTLQVENNDKEKIFHYFIEKCSNNRLESIETNEKTLIKKIHDPQVSIKDRLINKTLFKLPPKNKLYVFLFLEICYGKHFEYPEIYVEYLIQLPAGWSCGHLKSLKGRTQLAKAKNKDGLLHFGHCLEILLEFNFLDSEKTEYPNSPYIFFEVISKDSWDRYRTEGLCYISLPISHSGIFRYNLNCFRLTTVSPVGEMKRFFIGDCKNYTDITWIGINEKCISSSSSSSSSVLNKFGTHTVSTGILNVKLSTVHQLQEFLEREENLNSSTQHQRTTFERLGSTTLIKSVEQVIQEFKKARKEMLEAKKHV